MNMVQSVLLFCVGSILGWLVAKLLASQSDKKKEVEVSTLRAALQDRGEQLDESRAAIQRVQEVLLEKVSENGKLKMSIEHREKDLELLQQKFQTEFENVSHKMLKENSKEFAESSQQKIEALLAPLKQKIELFQADMQEVTKAGTAERLALKYKIESVADCSRVLAEETHRLTSALKGDIKKQGSWGELVLQRVLEASGLRENIEYTLQGSGMGLINEEGKRLQPDVIVHLPDEKHIIIDSKMSYAHFDEYLNKGNEDEKAESLKNLVQSLKEHVKELSDKNYQSAKKLNNPDFVLLFVPVEAIFSLVIQKEPSLFEDAWKRSIIIASPANILAILRTVSSIWKVERQNRNTQKIADDAAALYDKFVDLLKDLDAVGKSIHTAGDAFDKVLSKLSTGRGNLITKTENLRKLGLKTKKQIPEAHLPEEDEEIPLLQ